MVSLVAQGTFPSGVPYHEHLQHLQLAVPAEVLSFVLSRTSFHGNIRNWASETIQVLKMLGVQKRYCFP